MSFKQFKDNAMNGYEKAKKLNLVDKDLIEELDEFNTLENYYTTSSCSGRILLIKNEEERNKMPNAFYFKSHEVVKLIDIKNAINSYNEYYELWFKVEPFIIHIGCDSIDDADKLIRYCKEKGIKRAGINSLSRRIIVEVVGTQHIESLIIKDKVNLVNDNYLKILVEKANKKLMQGKNIIHSFFKDYKNLI